MFGGLTGQELALLALAGGGLVVILSVIVFGEGASVRYVVAMVFAVLAAAATTLLLASPVASWVTDHMRFDSPDGAASVHMFTFLGVNVAALFVGWMLGWILSKPFARRRRF